MRQTIFNKFKKNLPQIYKMAYESDNAKEFCNLMEIFANERVENSLVNSEVESAKVIIEMLSHESTYIKEFSREEKIFIETFSLLFCFLKEESPITTTSLDLFEDLYQLLSRATGYQKERSYSNYKFQKDMRRWPTGLDSEVIEIRKERKEKIVELLVDKIERRGAIHSKYRFEEGATDQEKKEMVLEWWKDFRFHLAMAIRTPGELNRFMDESLTSKTIRMLNRARRKGIPFFITPYYISLLNTTSAGFNDQTIRSYILYTESLIETYGNIKAWEREDRVVENEPNAAGWLLPEGNNIHRRYPEVAIMIPETRGRSCGGLCASCQRMYDFQSERFNFDQDELKPKESWQNKLQKLMDYFENDSQLRDILITGGDALMSRNKVLEKILDAVLKMARRKRERNLELPPSKRFHEIQRVRLGSRILAYLPMRIDDQLIEILKEFKKRGEEIGITQFIIQTHFQSPLEVTPDADRAIKKILSTGWIITNQLVFNTAASRRGHSAKLRQALNSVGIVPYYTFTVKGFEENREVFVPNSRSLQEREEEKSFGSMSNRQIEELNRIFQEERGSNLAKRINRFMREHSLPFLPTDRNVLNLPAVGKSFTFKTIGISKEGKRILSFSYDHTREHTPLIEKLEQIYIVESRSINSYLKELHHMGEKRDAYSSIWSYTSGETEPLFPLFQYPKESIETTSKITNFKG
ncbi:MAG: KamA family protein [Bacteroidales bacterium]